MTERAPFVSGLPGRPHEVAESSTVDPRGYARLVALRERAEADIKLLAPLCVRRFDGEWLEPDPDDIAAHAAATTAKQLVDLIVVDQALCARVTAQLARGGRTR